MPAGTRVDKMYKHLRASGYSEEDAAKIAQSKTGLSLQTGRPPKRARGVPRGKTEYKKTKR